jgi:dehydrogenase/reductase SDR family protein 4
LAFLIGREKGYFYIILIIAMRGKVAIITASSTGIGKAIALRLAEEGVKVIVSSRDRKNIQDTVDEIKGKGFEAHGIVCHVGKAEDRSRLIN